MMARAILAVAIVFAHALAATNDLRALKRKCRDEDTDQDMISNGFDETVCAIMQPLDKAVQGDPVAAGNPIACANAHLRYSVFNHKGEILVLTASLGFDTVQTCVRCGVDRWLSFASLPIVAGVYNAGYAAFINNVSNESLLSEAFKAHFTSALHDGRFADAVAMVEALRNDVERMQAGVHSAIIAAAKRNDSGTIHSLFAMCGGSLEYVQNALAPAAVAAVTSHALDALGSILDAILAQSDLLKHVSSLALIRALEIDSPRARSEILDRSLNMTDRGRLIVQAMHALAIRKPICELPVCPVDTRTQARDDLYNKLQQVFPELQDVVIRPTTILHNGDADVARRVSAAMQAATGRMSMLLNSIIPTIARDASRSTVSSFADAQTMIVRAAAAGHGSTVISALRFIASDPMEARDSVNAAIANASPHTSIAAMLVMAADYSTEYISINSIVAAAEHAATVGAIAQVAFMMDVCPDDDTRMRVGRAAVQAAHATHNLRVIDYVKLRMCL